ncbi:hypothetical protein PI125_g18633 [Phytophthora idaei]|nr:hypothetical protein PI125_g18633 [Phytophthora idaei]KAG3137956.1 hypothetical protein PI126_g17132 [Phytophthora idaei]
MSTKKLLWGLEHEGVVREDVVREDGGTNCRHYRCDLHLRLREGYGVTNRECAGEVFAGVRVDDAVSTAADSTRGGHVSVAAVPESPQPASTTLAGATRATTTPSRTPPIML